MRLLCMSIDGNISSRCCFCPNSTIFFLCVCVSVFCLGLGPTRLGNSSQGSVMLVLQYVTAVEGLLF